MSWDGYVRGKIRVKKLEEDSFFAIKIMKSTDDEGANSIHEKQESIREKRRERRQRSLDKEIVVEEIWDENEEDTIKKRAVNQLWLTALFLCNKKFLQNFLLHKKRSTMDAPCVNGKMLLNRHALVA